MNVGDPGLGGMPLLSGGAANIESGGSGQPNVPTVVGAPMGLQQQSDRRKFAPGYPGPRPGEGPDRQFRSELRAAPAIPAGNGACRVRPAPARSPAMSDPLPWLRRVTLIEAVSYVLLVGAMYVKWILQEPVGVLLVRYVGMAHGVLFLLMVWLLLRARFERRWPDGRLLLIFVASLVPIVPFFVDRRFPGWIAASGSRSA
jgi:integral membrane protein